MSTLWLTLTALAFVCAAGGVARAQVQVAKADRPNIVLVMADDQGWGETGYRNHPVLRTPSLDAMAENGIRFERFYAGAPVCSPTRASVLTGRSNNRTGVESHGYALRLQEKTLPQALKDAGYQTGHFGKWHLNGLKGPGVPVLADDDHNPGAFGFDKWLSVTNFFDRNPILSRQGSFEEFQGDSSEIVVDEALEFVAACARAQVPSFSVVWFGTPHSPFVAAPEDMESFMDLDKASRNHYGELVALDRSIGTLRSRLRELNIADNTLVWYCSDNGGLPKIQPETVGGLRGNKGSLYEGGLRVPGIVEWPNRIEAGQVSEIPASTMDIFATVSQIVGLPDSARLLPQDGISLLGVLESNQLTRDEPIFFNYQSESAMIDGQYKLLHLRKPKEHFELYDLELDPAETTNLVAQCPELANRLKQKLAAWDSSLADSVAGIDYPEAVVNPGEPAPRDWSDLDAYRPYFDDWRNRPEYRNRLQGK